MMTHEELHEALDASVEMRRQKGSEDVLVKLLSSRRIYGLMLGFIDHYDQGAPPEARASMREACRRHESEEQAESLQDEELDLRFLVVVSMAFGLTAGYCLHELQANYKPPQPRERMRRSRRR